MTNEKPMSVLFVADIQNLYHSCRDESAFGSDARVDYLKLVEEARNGRPLFLMYPVAYISAYFYPEEQNTSPKLFHVLKKYGYHVSVGYSTDASPRLNACMSLDLKIIKDIVDMSQGFDCVVVASGDGDFIPCYRLLRNRGLRVEVLSFKHSLNTRVPGEVDEVRLLSASCLFKRSPIGLEE